MQSLLSGIRRPFQLASECVSVCVAAKPGLRRGARGADDACRETVASPPRRRFTFNLRGCGVIVTLDGRRYAGTVITHTAGVRWLIEVPKLPPRLQRRSGDRRVSVTEDQILRVLPDRRRPR
jgi:hypothetical protein